MSNGDSPAGPFHYTGPEGFEAWGYRFPSEFIILKWIPESVLEDEQTIYNGHQSLYHSFADFRTTCTGDIEWGRTPLEDDSLEFSERQRERFERVREECPDDHLPVPTDDQTMKSLIDMWDAVADSTIRVIRMPGEVCTTCGLEKIGDRCLTRWCGDQHSSVGETFGTDIGGAE